MNVNVCQVMVEQPSYTVRNVDRLVPMEEFIRECVKVFQFTLLCAECENYGQRWTCPPFDFAPMQLWRKYKSIQLFGRILAPETDVDASAMLAALEREKDILLNELLDLEKKHPGSLALSAGCCTICDEGCNRPDKRPCRHRDKMRYSIESLGGDVAKASERYLDTPLLWIKGGVVPDYLTLVGGLLLKEGKKVR